MRERDYQLAAIADDASEVMYMLWEDESQHGGLDLDAMLLRLKDLSAYSLTHADIMVRREGVEFLALAKFFGMTSEPQYHPNQEHLAPLSQEAIEYQGQAEVIEGEIAAREARRPQEGEDDETETLQPRLF